MTEMGIEFIYNIVFIILFCSYVIYFPGSKYMATPGKMLAGIIITDKKGSKISYLRSAGRLCATWLSNLTFCIGYIICLFNKQKRCLHDFIAGTIVVKKDKPNRFFVLIVILSIFLPFILGIVVGMLSFDGMKNLSSLIAKNESEVLKGSIVFEDSFKLQIANKNKNVAGVAKGVKSEISCDIEFKNIDKTVPYSGVPQIKLSAVIDAKGESIHTKEQNSDFKVKESEDGIFSDSLNIKEGKSCSDITLVKGFARIDVVKRLSTINLSMQEDLEDKYDVADGKYIILTKSDKPTDASGNIEYVLEHNFDADVSLDLLDANKQKIIMSSTPKAKLNDISKISYSFKNTGFVPEEATIEFPAEVETKLVPFTFNFATKNPAISKERQEKLKKYMQMAKNGDAKAQYLLGYAYSKGDIVEKDLQKMQYWLGESAANGYDEAKKALEDLAGK